MENLGVFSLKLFRLPGLSAFTGMRPKYIRFFGDADCYAGWGYGKLSLQARADAKRKGKNFLYLEEGFLRSLYPSAYSPAPLSVTLDRRCPYYDAFQISDLELLLTDGASLSSAQTNQAKDALDLFLTNRLGKYVITGNEYAVYPPVALDENACVLIDQTAGDLSLIHGGVKKREIRQAAEIALQEAGDRPIFLKTHPDVIAGVKKSCFSFLLDHPRVTPLCPDLPLHRILDCKPKLHVLTSLAGFEAVLRGVETVCHGLPWYAGYGFTQDRHEQAAKIAERRKSGAGQTTESFFAKAYLQYPVYLNPADGKRGDFFSAADVLATRARRARDLSGNLYAYGFRRWKQKDISPFIKTPYNRVHFLYNEQEALALGYATDLHAKRAVWGYKKPEILEKLAEKRNTPLLRYEDGFIRSVGLGCDFIPPFSLAVDKGHLYYRANGEPESDIRKLMRSYQPAQHKRDRAAKILQFIRKEGVTKYNLSEQNHLELAGAAKGREVIFVPGQIDDDASVRFGSSDKVKNCLDLLKRVRLDFPKAFILFKPHPEILDGNRKNAASLVELQRYCDQITKNASALHCIDLADRIACITSLTGFEALIRLKPVTLYGKPFYAGTGLTHEPDGETEPNFHFTLEDLAHIVLIDYPTYSLKKNGTDDFSEIEEVLTEIIRKKNVNETNPFAFLRQIRVIKNLYKIKKWIFQ